MGYFSYYNKDPQDIRNISEYGGGAMMDIGCYLVFTARFIFGEEPTEVSGLVEEDPQTRTDVLTSAILKFPSGQAAFTCGTQLAPYQRVQILGDRGRIEVEIPFNAPPDRPCRVFVEDRDASEQGAEVMEFGPSDQYTIQGDIFSRSIREGIELPVPLEGSVKNMVVIEAVLRSAKSGNWEKPISDG
jgi:predicted dehydrogenase